MTLLASAPAWLAIVLALLLLAAALEDMWRLEIANILSGGVAIAAFVAVAIDGPIIGLWQNLLLFAAVLAVGTLLFARGVMGGGDIKLLAAGALWFDLSQGWKMLVAVALAIPAGAQLTSDMGGEMGAPGTSIAPKDLVRLSGSVQQRSGDEVRGTVSATIAPGWHINSAKPLDGFVIPTKLSFDPATAQLVSAEYPPRTA